MRPPRLPGQLKAAGVIGDAGLPLGLPHPENVADEIQILDAGEMLVQIGVVGNVGGDAFAGHRVALHRMAVY